MVIEIKYRECCHCGFRDWTTTLNRCPKCKCDIMGTIISSFPEEPGEMP